MKKWREMSKDEAMELLHARGGVDVWGYMNARHLRLIQREVNPEFLWIGEAMDSPKDGAKKQPYFGCKATALGILEAKRILGIKNFNEIKELR